MVLQFYSAFEETAKFARQDKKMPASQEDEGFEALLKPIQDLTRNWEVDLSLHLEEYINYIRQICGDNIPDMNFAQAAVLVQNSANIYSKKVDFLFTTVLQLLDTLCKKQTEAKNRESGQEESGQSSGRRRKALASIDTEEFTILDDVCSDRALTLNIEKEKQKVAERKKQKIVLNAAIKVKAKEKTSCNVYHSGQDVMGKKEEFRLNWRICSAGTLHEEFVINRNRFKVMEPVNISVYAPEESHHDYEAPGSDHGGEDQPPPSPGEEPPPTSLLVTSLFSIAPVDRESEDRGLGEVRLRKEAAKTVDVNECLWQPNDFNYNLQEKPLKKKKVVTIPTELEFQKKRKHYEENVIDSFTITDVWLDQYKNGCYFRDLDFCFHSKMIAKHKRQLLLQHRAKYQAYLEREAGLEQDDDFHGFYNEDRDSDNEHDFEGFGDVHEDDEVADVDVPLPDKNSIINPGWKGEDINTYDNEAMRTIQAFRSRKIDHDRITDMAKRVEEWHQKILPKLEAAEERSSFDIHAYGSKILNTFSGEIGSVKSFDEIVAGESREEVARYFLSSLMLANQYNVQITETEPGDLNVDCMQLKLLSIVRHHEELDDNLRETADK